MALAASNVVKFSLGNKRAVTATVTADDSYPTGGETLSPSLLGLSKLDAVIIASQDVTGGTHVIWDRANAKLKILVEDGTSGVHAEAANASDQSGVAVEVVAIGR